MHIYAAISPAGRIIGGVATRSFSRFDGNLSDSAFVIKNLKHTKEFFQKFNQGAFVSIDFPDPLQRPRNSQSPSREIILFALCEILRWAVRAAVLMQRGRAHALVHLWNAAEVYCTLSLLLLTSPLLT